MPSALPPPLTGANLRRLVALRWLSISVMLAATFALPPVLGVEVPTWALLAILLALFAINLFTLARLAQPGAPEPWPAAPFTHLLVDIVAWSLFVHFIGGATNPLISLLLPLVAIGAAILPAREAWGLAGIAVGAYSLLWMHYVPLHIDDDALAMRWHLAGMWVTFALSAAVVVGFVVRLNAALRARDTALAAANEAIARDERIVALGNLAAGAAHNLGTPLGTMRIVIDELLRAPPDQAALREDLALLGDQVEHCRRTLSLLTAEAGSVRAEGGRPVAVAGWIGDTVAQWRSQRPGCEIRIDCDAALADLTIVADTTLAQALHTLVNNAADAHPANAAEPVTVDAKLAGRQLIVAVSDRGRGMSAAQRANAGRVPGGGGNGMGIGLFLARRALERCGGELAFEARAGGGTVARMILPLERLQP